MSDTINYKQLLTNEINNRDEQHSLYIDCENDIQDATFLLNSFKNDRCEVEEDINSSIADAGNERSIIKECSDGIDDITSYVVLLDGILEIDYANNLIGSKLKYLFNHGNLKDYNESNECISFRIEDGSNVPLLFNELDVLADKLDEALDNEGFAENFLNQLSLKHEGLNCNIESTLNRIKKLKEYKVSIKNKMKLHNKKIKKLNDVINEIKVKAFGKSKYVDYNIVSSRKGLNYSKCMSYVMFEYETITIVIDKWSVKDFICNRSRKEFFVTTKVSSKSKIKKNYWYRLSNGSTFKYSEVKSEQNEKLHSLFEEYKGIGRQQSFKFE